MSWRGDRASLLSELTNGCIPDLGRGFLFGVMSSEESTPLRRKFNAEDEAKFAQLEPDGLHPNRNRRRSAATDKWQGAAVLAAIVVFGLYVVWPSGRPTASRPTESIPTPPVATARPAARGESDDVVVVNAAAAKAVPPAERSSESAAAVATDTSSDVGVILRSAGGDENVLVRHSPPPPPFTASAAQRSFLEWLVGRQRRGKARPPSSSEVAVKMQ